ncbi:helix-turn-helix domain-containing protein [Streptomyces sp. NPDC005863]|uniref:helix-turn-helix domain-containing protein n=1 Tax=Streptomyces sp. NPDC005863 TaxID=3364735 RepID=UPI003695EB40
MPDLAAANATINGLYLEVGQRMTAARKAHGYTQADLGRAVGLSRSSIANIESAVQRAPFHTLLGIAQALGVDPAGLLLSDDPPQVAPPMPSINVKLRRRLLAARTEIDTLLEAIPDNYDKGDQS